MGLNFGGLHESKTKKKTQLISWRMRAKSRMRGCM